MNIRAKLAPEQQLTIEEYLSFTETRPQEERWELIEGVAVLNPSPVQFHQVIASNIVSHLVVHKQQTNAPWIAMLGVGTRVPASPRSLPQPDVFVQAGAATDRPDTDDALVIFEILSRSNTKADQAWRRKVYASIPNCQHYVTVSQKKIDVTVFSRADDWTAQRMTTLTDKLVLPHLGVVMLLAEIYRWTLLGAGD
jgi:Uma2 family endonuclease